MCCLFNASSQAGEVLVNVLNDRRGEVAVRAIAARSIAQVGFLEAIPALENLAGRLAGRSLNQLGMRFAPKADPEAEVLLPAVNEALKELEARA